MPTSCTIVHFYAISYFVYFGGGGSTLEQAEVRTFFESQFTDANAASQGNNASANVAGKYQDGTSIRLFAANGLEPQQVLLKGLMGACFMDQIVNNYLSTTGVLLRLLIA